MSTYAVSQASSLNGKTFDILNTPLYVTTYRDLVDECRRLVRDGGTWAIDFTNTHIVTLRRHDPSFRAITSCFDHFIPDGMPLIWCLNLRGARLHDRVYGPTFMRLCVSESQASFSHYLLGGSENCLPALRKNLLSLNPAARIVGSHHGYFTPEQEGNIVDEIKRLSPDFIWVGLGTPKQQQWICRHKSRIDRGVIFAVGFAFDVNAGTKPDAPLWMQRHGLTWIFRIWSEPQRLLLRYLRYNSLFLFYLLKDSLRSARA